MRRKKRGFTILELILALSISVIILGAVFSLYILSNKIYGNVNVNSDLQIEAHNAEEKIKNPGMGAVKIDAITLVNGQIDNFGTDKELKYNRLTNLKDIDGKELQLTANDNEKYLILSEITIIIKEEVAKANPSDPTTTQDVSYTIKHVPTDDPDNKTKPRGKLTIQRDGGAEQVIGEDIENITIKPSNPYGRLSQADSIQFNINLAKKKGFSDIKYSIPINITFRNKYTNS